MSTNSVSLMRTATPPLADHHHWLTKPRVRRHTCSLSTGLTKASRWGSRPRLQNSDVVVSTSKCHSAPGVLPLSGTEDVFELFFLLALLFLAGLKNLVCKVHHRPLWFVT
ncbi:hypothetical protein HPB50_020647 [Hyalomma asiaticum]|uniref:Uncharacterized protein n=1 Tax=Hyalomma asiaticum TaxID=266040 RepID=A0ACB7S9Z2_HYAAI|nr:hypothetical protein HPB50_020647 [Hyalomma asiaticum]